MKRCRVLEGGAAASERIGHLEMSQSKSRHEDVHYSFKTTVPVLICNFISFSPSREPIIGDGLPEIGRCLDSERTSISVHFWGPCGH